MADQLDAYRRADETLATEHLLWPLSGAGFENLGVNGAPVGAPVPTYGPDELLVRHDACGLCFSDIKIITQGEEHPRIRRRMAEDPVVLGHEIAMTVVGVGETLRETYRVGDRLTIQSDVIAGGVGYAYGYEIPGGLAQYNVIDRRVLQGDEGDYLLRVKDDTGYAEAALTEPWASVTAAYALTYRTGLKAGGTTWIVGGGGPDRGYSIGAGFDESSHPAQLLLSAVPEPFDAWLRARAAALSIEVIDVPDVAAPPVAFVDDIVLLEPAADLVETVSPRLGEFGILALMGDRPSDRKVSVDVGRIHYDRRLYVGGRDPDVARAYRDRPVRSALRSGGQAWFVGGGGPMGRMHIQRAIQLPGAPRLIVCTDVSDERLADLTASFGVEAEARGIEFVCVNPSDPADSAGRLAQLAPNGFDDVVVLAPAPAVLAEAAEHLADGGVMNVFAGMARGTFASLDLGDIVARGVRVIGHSASTIAGLRQTLDQVESGLLSTNRSVAAIGSLDAVRDGLLAVRDNSFPGKVIIYPQIRDFPLTALPDLKETLPTVYAKLVDGRVWTNEAEEELLRLLVPSRS
jgi:threonine dehydrogenase-like Zn-dependent dehydrogenase